MTHCTFCAEIFLESHRNLIRQLRNGHHAHVFNYLMHDEWWVGRDEIVHYPHDAAAEYGRSLVVNCCLALAAEFRAMDVDVTVYGMTPDFMVRVAASLEWVADTLTPCPAL